MRSAIFQKSAAILLQAIWVVASLAGSTASLAATPTTTIEADAFRSDVTVLRASLEGLHPGLYRYSTKEAMDARFDALAASATGHLTLPEAFVRIAKFLNTIECGHTYNNFLNQPAAVAAELLEGPRVPFYFSWVDDDRMIVTRDFTSQHSLPIGTEVTAIDSIKIRDILSRLLTIARADGANEGKRRSYLEVRGDSDIEAFDVFLPMLFAIAPHHMELDVTLPDGTSRTLQVEAGSAADRAAAVRGGDGHPKESNQPLFDWRYLQDGAAYLRMPTWSLYRTKWDWHGWLDAHIDEAIDRSTPYLIIDIRGNEGGLDVGDALISRLIASKVDASALQRYVRYRKTPPNLDQYLDTWDASFRDWGDAAKEPSSALGTLPPVHYFRLTKFDDDEKGSSVQPSGRRYQGKVFVLIDSSNSSATFQFAQLVKNQGLGTLVGQPTGGSLRGINGGAFFFLRLPNSHIEVDLPLIGTFASSEQPDRGLTPDILVEHSREDIVDGIDPEIRAVQALVLAPPTAAYSWRHCQPPMASGLLEALPCWPNSRQNSVFGAHV